MVPLVGGGQRCLALVEMLFRGGQRWWSGLSRRRRRFITALGGGRLARRAGADGAALRFVAAAGLGECSRSAGVRQESAIQCIPPCRARCGCQPPYMIAAVMEIGTWPGNFVGVARCSFVASGLMPASQERSHVVVAPVVQAPMLPRGLLFCVKRRVPIQRSARLVPRLCACSGGRS